MAKYQFDSKVIAVTDTTVCPDLVDPLIYGHHKSRVYDGKRIWTFDSKDSHVEKFKREVKAGAFRRS